MPKKTKPSRNKAATVTQGELPAHRKPLSSRPPTAGSSPPMGARVDIVLADLRKDPRTK